MERRVRVLRIGCVLRRVVVHSEMKNTRYEGTYCECHNIESDGLIENIRHHGGTWNGYFAVIFYKIGSMLKY